MGEERRDRACAVLVSFSGASPGLAEGGHHEGAPKGGRVTSPLPMTLRGGQPGWARPLGGHPAPACPATACSVGRAAVGPGTQPAEAGGKASREALGGAMLRFT